VNDSQTARPQAAPIIAVTDLVKQFGRFAALRGVSASFEAARLYGILGDNGAGKTTLLRSISGLIPPRAGRVMFEGRDITRVPPHEIVGLGISQSPEGRMVFANLTVEDNLELGAYRRKDRAGIKADRESVFTLFPRLLERRRQTAGTLSGGEQQMLALSRALMSEPRLLCMDEPSLGLAPLVVQDIFRSIRAANAAGTSVLLVEQNARYALETASRGYVLQTGRIIASGPCAALKQDERVKEAYLGRR
jgi:branched-chain amino acid transport system ATP-binding protein